MFPSLALRLDFCKQECIPVGCILLGEGVSASVHAGIPPICGPGDPQGVDLETPQVWAWRPPWVWGWRPLRPDLSTFTLGVDLETPQARPLNFPLRCGTWRPARHAGILPLLETCKACWDTTCNACWDTTPPPCEQND